MSELVSEATQEEEGGFYAEVSPIDRARSTELYNLVN